MTFNCSQELVEMIIETMGRCGDNLCEEDFDEVKKFYINHLDSLDGTALKAWDTFQEYYGGTYEWWDLIRKQKGLW